MGFINPIGVSTQPCVDRFHYIYQYTGSIFKIVQLYRDTPPLRLHSGKAAESYDHKLDASYSRARRTLLELALCNPWDYFATFTINSEKQDRFDLDQWYKRFYEMIKYQRKVHGLKCRYVFVPERHKDGAWHAHGLFSGNMELISFADLAAQGVLLPDKLRNSSYLNWSLYQNTFGNCSFGPIRDPIASGFYMTKYITKDLANCVQDVGKHLYYASQGLNRSIKLGSMLVRSDYLDSLLVNKYEYCATGMVQPGEGWYSDFVYDMLESFPVPQAYPFQVFDFKGSSDPSAPECESDEFYQTCFDLGSDLRFFSPG